MRGKIARMGATDHGGPRSDEPFAATRIVSGTDVDYGALTHLLVKQLVAQPGFSVHYLKQVTDISRNGGQWRVETEDTETSERQSVNAKFVFIGAGGDAICSCKSRASRKPKVMAVFPSAASGCAAT